MNAKTYIKDSLKKSFIYPALIYFRYLCTRYVFKRHFANYKAYKNSKIEIVDKDINFFGYYNISPENRNGDILFLKVKNEKVRGSIYEPVSIMLKKNNGEIIKLAATKSWNWQQGCMLQWHPTSDVTIIYNDYSTAENAYISKHQHIRTGEIKTICQPLYAVSKSGRFALSLNFDLLALMRPDYGYFNRNITWKDMPNNSNDSIWYIDFKKNEPQLIITLDALINFQPSDTMIDAKHKVNHIDINPSGSRFMFLHRWVGPQGRFMRLITANRDGTELFVVNGDKMTSHSCWVNDSEIISYCNIEGEGNGYFRFVDRHSDAKLISEKLPKQDGHPSISPDGKWLLTDTYPDLARMSYLILYNIERNKIIELGRFYQPIKYQGEMRIDLHPKWRANGRQIFFESGHAGKRQLYYVDVSKIINEQN